jgi:hypothetical protein
VTTLFIKNLIQSFSFCSWLSVTVGDCAFQGTSRERTHDLKLKFAAGYTILVVLSLNDGIAVVSLLLPEPGDQEAQPRSPGRNEPFSASVIDLGAAA